MLASVSSHIAILDFGQSCNIPREAEPSTKADIVIVTFFMAPTVEGEMEFSKRMDVQSLAILVARMTCSYSLRTKCCTRTSICVEHFAKVAHTSTQIL